MRAARENLELYLNLYSKNLSNIQPLIISAKRSILNVSQCSEYVSVVSPLQKRGLY